MNKSLLERGYMQEGEFLDALSMRPYKNSRGETVVTVRKGFKVVQQNGISQRVPVFAEKRVFQNALLRKYEWEEIDATILDISRQPMVGIQDLVSAGLTHRLAGIGTSISTYEQLGDMSDATVSMNVTPKKDESDRVVFDAVSVPVPIISKPFSLDLRTLDASRRLGESLDVTQARVATLKVREKLEDILFNGHGIQMQDLKVYGYTNHPNIGSGTAASYGGGDWGTDGNGHKTLVGMISALVAKGFNGPYGVYVSPTQYAQSMALTGANMSETQLSVIRRTVEDIKFIKRAPKLADGRVLMVQMTREVVDLAIGQDITPISWQEYGGLMNEFRVLTAAVPRIKYDIEGKVGIEMATAA
ncbi:MAG: family 1 encapsulin nanocompartment shell protein [Casimicrobiaceae bacterium]